mmetsp:Transcript_10236/g.26601  ORF Transcript_10236/g.26601 Transcript_10236/m.26601 type:complete len:272 (-) Transcript_10236:217-1032(-)
MSTLTDVVRIGMEANILGARAGPPKRLRASARPTPRTVTVRTGFAWVRHDRFAPFVASWKRRWLELDFERRILTIYREDKRTFINFLDLRRCALAPVAKPGAERRGAFTVTSPLSTRTIAAEDEEVSKAWMAEIMRAAAEPAVVSTEGLTAAARRERRDMSRAQRRERAALLLQARFRLHLCQRHRQRASWEGALRRGDIAKSVSVSGVAESKLAARRARRRLATSTGTSTGHHGDVTDVDQFDGASDSISKPESSAEAVPTVVHAWSNLN